MKVWIVIHTHRHGTDVVPVFQDTEPSEREAIDALPSEFEPDREDEYIEIRGSWEVPA